MVMTSKPFLTCAGCKVTHYCSNLHYVMDCADHDSPCCHIRNCRAAGDWETGRFELARALYKWQTKKSITEALQLFNGLIDSSQGYYSHARDCIPTLLLQLDQDQECYDLIKSHTVLEECPDYSEDGDGELIAHDHGPGADVLESPTHCCAGQPHDTHLVALNLLLKLKLLVDVINIRRVRNVLAGRLLPELVMYVQREAVRSPLSIAFCQRDDAVLQALQTTLLWHVDILRYRLGKLCRYFVETLLGRLYEYICMDPPDAHQADRAVTYLRSVAAAWHQTDGVVQLLKAAFDAAMRDRERETETKSGIRDFRGHPLQGSYIDWTETERFHWDDSIVRMWDHLESVVNTQTFTAQGSSTARPTEQSSTLMDVDVREQADAAVACGEEDIAGGQSVRAEDDERVSNVKECAVEDSADCDAVMMVVLTKCSTHW